MNKDILTYILVIILEATVILGGYFLLKLLGDNFPTIKLMMFLMGGPLTLVLIISLPLLFAHYGKGEKKEEKQDS